METMPVTLAARLSALSRAEGLWRGALIGFVVGTLSGAALAVAVIRGALS